MTGQEWVLVADDEPHMRRTLGLVLRRSGVQVTLAEDGDEALAQARRIRPRIVILDAQMPGLTGYEVCRQLRADAEPPHVIMLTGGGQDADRAAAEACGVNEFLTKPFSPSQLVKRVNAIMAGGVGREGPVEGKYQRCR